MKINLDSLFIIFCVVVFIGLLCMVYNINLLSQNNFNISNIYDKRVWLSNRETLENTHTYTQEGFKVRDDFSNRKISKKFKKFNKKPKDPFDEEIDYSKYGGEDFYEQFNNTNQRLNNVRTRRSDNNNLEKINNKNIKKHKMGRKSKMDSKLEQFTKSKNSKVRSNFTDLKNMDKSNTSTDNKLNNRKSAKDTLSALKQISNDANPGSVDTFQNVLDELDNIDIGTFKFKNITGVVSHYNDNLKNRLKHADKKGYTGYDKTIAKGGVLFDELKKLMSYTSLT
jgi:hypothetical protein